MATTSANHSLNPVVFKVMIPWPQVESAYQKRLESLASQTTVEGFRPGKAPKKLVEEKVGKKAIFSDVISDILPPKYQEEVKAKKLSPFISPRVKVQQINEGQDWVFEVTVVTKPVATLGDYESKIKAALASGKIVVPGKKNESSSEEKMKTAFDALLSVTQVELPQVLVDEEVNMRLSRLVDQLQALGMTVEQYLQSKNLTADQLRESYVKTAQDMFKLNLALDKVAQDQGFTDKDRLSEAVDWLISR